MALDWGGKYDWRQSARGGLINISVVVVFLFLANNSCEPFPSKLLCFFCSSFSFLGLEAKGELANRVNLYGEFDAVIPFRVFFFSPLLSSSVIFRSPYLFCALFGFFCTNYPAAGSALLFSRLPGGS